jgi:hypothetical protein
MTINCKVRAHAKFAALNPGEVALHMRRIQRLQDFERIKHPEEGKHRSPNGDGADHHFRQLAAKQAIDQKAAERQRGDEPEVRHCVSSSSR